MSRYKVELIYNKDEGRYELSVSDVETGKVDACFIGSNLVEDPATLLRLVTTRFGFAINALREYEESL